jgi:hypothetical protein
MNEFPDRYGFGPEVPDPGRLPEVPIGAEGDTGADPAADAHPFDADTSGIGCELEPEEPVGENDTTDTGTEARATKESHETHPEISLAKETPADADVDNMRALHYAIRTTLAHAAPPDGQPEDASAASHERPLDAEAVPEPVQEALNAVAPAYDGAEVTYTQRATLTQSDSSGEGEQTASIQFKRDETGEGATTRSTEVRYDVSRRPGETEQGLPAARYEMTRTAEVTSGLAAEDTPPLVARAGDAPLAPGETRMTWSEAREVIDHLTSQHEANVPSDTDLPGRGHELADEPIETVWRYDANETDPTVTLTIGGLIAGKNIASYIGTLIADDSPTYDHPGLARGPLVVDPEFRQAGLANRLVAGMAQVAIDNGMERLRGPVDSPHTVRAFSRITEPNALHFSDVVPTAFDNRGKPTAFEMVELPMTPEQAIASLELAAEQRIADHRPDRDISIGFTIDTAGINRDMLESPIHITPPLGPRSEEEAERS